MMSSPPSPPPPVSSLRSRFEQLANASSNQQQPLPKPAKKLSIYSTTSLLPPSNASGEELAPNGIIGGAVRSRIVSQPGGFGSGRLSVAAGLRPSSLSISGTARPYIELDPEPIADSTTTTSSQPPKGSPPRRPSTSHKSPNLPPRPALRNSPSSPDLHCASPDETTPTPTPTISSIASSVQRKPPPPPPRNAKPTEETSSQPKIPPPVPKRQAHQAAAPITPPRSPLLPPAITLQSANNSPGSMPPQPPPLPSRHASPSTSSQELSLNAVIQHPIDDLVDVIDLSDASYSDSHSWRSESPTPIATMNGTGVSSVNGSSSSVNLALPPPLPARASPMLPPRPSLPGSPGMVSAPPVICSPRPSMSSPRPPPISSPRPSISSPRPNVVASARLSISTSSPMPRTLPPPPVFPSSSPTEDVPPPLPARPTPSSSPKESLPPPLPVRRSVSLKGSDESLNVPDAGLGVSGILPPPIRQAAPGRISPPSRPSSSPATRSAALPPLLSSKTATTSSKSSAAPLSKPAAKIMSATSSTSYLPPPPTRTIQPGQQLPPARKRSSGSDDDDDSGGSSSDTPATSSKPKSGSYYSTTQNLGVGSKTHDDLPDSSHSSRRPPLLFKYQPSIPVPAHVGVVAVSGARVVVGTSHHIKVYDLAVSDSQPVGVLDLKEVGRGSGSKVSCMEWRVGAWVDGKDRVGEEEEGRWLWIGTKDGQLWEMDVLSCEIVAVFNGVPIPSSSSAVGVSSSSMGGSGHGSSLSRGSGSLNGLTGTKVQASAKLMRSSGHAGMITHILRWSGGMITIDDSGKGFMFAKDDRGICRLSNTSYSGSGSAFAPISGSSPYSSANSSPYPSSSSASSPYPSSSSSPYASTSTLGLGPSSEQDLAPISRVTPIRIAEKQGFAKVFDGQLWMSHGAGGSSSSSSTGLTSEGSPTGAMSGGVVVRCYDLEAALEVANAGVNPSSAPGASATSGYPNGITSSPMIMSATSPSAPGSSSNPAMGVSSVTMGGTLTLQAKTMMISESVGAVMAGTMLPSRPGWVFLAHEGGWVSVWPSGATIPAGEGAGIGGVSGEALSDSPTASVFVGGGGHAKEGSGESTHAFSHLRNASSASTTSRSSSRSGTSPHPPPPVHYTSPNVPPTISPYPTHPSSHSSSPYGHAQTIISKPTAIIKLSSSAILTLEGVNDRLWAGGRNGLISVYDVECVPWRVTNWWKGHEGSVGRLWVDVGGLVSGSRLAVLSVGRDEQLRFWDGLLAYDWIDAELLKRERQFSKFRDIKVLICSWNVDAAKPEALYDMVANAEGNGGEENTTFLKRLLKGEGVDGEKDGDGDGGMPPDVIVFGFQEMINLEDRKLTAKTVLLSKSKKHEGALSDKVSRSYRLWYNALVGSMPHDCPYTVVHTENLVGLFTCIFVRNSEKASLKDVAITTVKRGMGGRYGNKGAIVARFTIDDSSLCFINCHLAAGQNHKRQRNQDLAAILEEKAVFPDAVETSSSFEKSLAYVGGGDGSMILDHEICFLNGDLNYRIDQRRDSVLTSIRAKEIDYLLTHDQLLKEMFTNPGFRLRSFTEAPIHFLPTYKYDRRSNTYDSSEKRRAPAWCDRILYRSRDASRVQNLHYRRYEVNVSDHRPISAAYRVVVKRIEVEKRESVRGGVEVEWRERQRRLLIDSRKFYLGLVGV